MYEFALILHNALRLIALLLLLVVVARGFQGWFGGRVFGREDRLWNLVLLIVVDLQFVLGLLLYLVWSPVVKSALSNMGAAMKDPELRRWAVEHPTMMIAALVLLHVGSVLRKRLLIDTQRHKWVALTAAVALLLVIVGTTWPWSESARPLLRLPS